MLFVIRSKFYWKMSQLNVFTAISKKTGGDDLKDNQKL